MSDSSYVDSEASDVSFKLIFEDIFIKIILFLKIGI